MQPHAPGRAKSGVKQATRPCQQGWRVLGVLGDFCEASFGSPSAGPAKLRIGGAAPRAGAAVIGFGDWGPKRPGGMYLGQEGGWLAGGESGAECDKARELAAGTGKMQRDHTQYAG
jgi:hypothetical protein